MEEEDITSSAQPPLAVRHLYDNPHVLFPEPPLPFFARRDNWVVHTVATGDAMVEVTLTRTSDVPPSGSPSSSSSTSSSSAATTATGTMLPAKPGVLQPVFAPSVVPVRRQTGLVQSLMAVVIAAALFTLWPVSVPPPSPASSTTTTLIPTTTDAGSGNAAPPSIASALVFAAEVAVRMGAALLLSKLVVGKSVVQESVAAVRGLGLQLTTVYDDGSRESTFIEAGSIRGVIVNEGIRRCRVIYYLAVAASGRKNLVLLFEHSQPRLPTVAHIYSTFSKVLAEPLVLAERQNLQQ
jgi:hypothetical protein